jgi:hypothetical protein
VANLESNPWSLFPADIATATITAATGLTLNPDGTVTITTTGALTFNTSTSVPPALWFTVVNPTNLAYQGLYKLIVGASGGTTFTMAPQFPIPAGTAQSGSGPIAQCLWPWEVRIEDISWQNVAAAGQVLDLRDRNGNPLWMATSTGAGSQNRGKLFWVAGLTPVAIPSGVVIATID